MNRQGNFPSPTHPQSRLFSQLHRKPSCKIQNLPSLLLTLAAGAGIAAYFFLPDRSRSAPTSLNAPLSPTHFTPSIVISSEISGPDTKLITLQIDPSLIPKRDSKGSPVWSVCIKDDDIQVERPYTPLEGIDTHGRMTFWIKQYPKGEVGRWIHSKHVGDQIELRGPLTTWPWQDNHWDEVIMISGGTGITPFYQLFHIAVATPSPPKTRFTLLHSSRTLADVPPPSILQPIIHYAQEHPDRFRLQLFVDGMNGRSSDTNNLAPSIPVHNGRIDKQVIEQYTGQTEQSSLWTLVTRFLGLHKSTPNKKTLFLVCGPEPMINSVAGPYGRNFSQGAVGGALGDLGYTSSQVWKL